MGGAKYICDYCEKEFKDTLGARKRHLQGVFHQRAKALWYSNYNNNININNNYFNNNNNIIHQNVLPKGVCNRFVTTGSCSYGDSCKYIHPRQSLQSLIPQSISGSVVKGNVRVSLGSLPPSLQPPPEGGYPQLPFIDWG